VIAGLALTYDRRCSAAEAGEPACLTCPHRPSAEAAP
jgi:hypothetical protein